MFFKALCLLLKLDFFYDDGSTFGLSCTTLERLKEGTLKGLLDPDDYYYYSLLGFAAENICLSFG